MTTENSATLSAKKLVFSAVPSAVELIQIPRAAFSIGLLVTGLMAAAVLSSVGLPALSTQWAICA
jgi:hypothetical protein